MVFILSKIKCFFRLLQSAALHSREMPPMTANIKIPEPTSMTTGCIMPSPFRSVPPFPAPVYPVLPVPVP